MFALQGQAAQFKPSFQFKHLLNDRRSIIKNVEHLNKTAKYKKHKRVYNNWYYEVVTTYHVTDEQDEDPIVFSVKRRKATPEVCCFDTDAYAIGINTYTSRCISPFIQDFEKGSLEAITSRRSVRPFGKGSILNIDMCGTLKWNFQDNSGRTHKF